MAGQGQGEYNVDIVMCIDGTGSMSPIINEVKEHSDREKIKQIIRKTKNMKEKINSVWDDPALNFQENIEFRIPTVYHKLGKIALEDQRIKDFQAKHNI